MENGFTPMGMCRLRGVIPAFAAALSLLAAAPTAGSHPGRGAAAGADVHALRSHATGAGGAPSRIASRGIPRVPSAPRIRAGSPPATGRAAKTLDLLPGDCCPPDDRYLITGTTTYPYSAVCKVVARFPSGRTFIGSAAMVGRRVAVTAGHVIYDADEGGWASQVTVSPGYDDGWSPWGAHQGTYLHSVAGWVDFEDFGYDFGLIEFATPVGDSSGWLGYASRSDGNLVGASVQTAGFPADVANGERMVGAAGSIWNVSPSTLYIAGTLDVSAGQSGSGVWTWTGGEPYVVGVVSWGSLSTNGAVRITNAFFDDIAELNGDGGGGPDGENLSVVLGKSRLLDFATPGADGVKLRIFYDVEDGAPSPTVDPVTRGVTLGVAFGSTDAWTLEIPPENFVWSLRGRAKRVWNGWVGATRVRMTWNLLRGTIALKADWFDFEAGFANPVTVWIECGPHAGSDTAYFRPRRPGTFAY